jgi:hypothetical protein
LFLGDDFIAVYWFDYDVNLDDFCKAINDLDAYSGITPERALFTSILDISFISLRVWRTRSGGVAMVPNLARQFNKLFWTTSRPGCEARRRAIAGGICEAFMETYAGFEAMTSFLQNHRSDRTIEYQAYNADLLAGVGRDIDWAAGFLYHYGLPLAAIPKRFPRFDTAPIVCRHPVIEVMLGIEGLDPRDRPRCAGRS